MPEETYIHLCDYCGQHPAECNAPFDEIEFGTLEVRGNNVNDAVIKCSGVQHYESNNETSCACRFSKKLSFR